MKLALTSALTLLAAFSVTAQTRVDIVPQRPVTCVERDYPRVSWVKDIEKIDETAETATFEFVMEHGHCENNEPQAVGMENDLAFVGMMKSDGGLFEGDHVKVKSELISPTSVKVRAVFKTAKIFRDGTVQQKYDMGFYPNGIPLRPFTRDQVFLYRQLNANRYRYPWFLYISREADGGAHLEVRND